MPVFLVGGQPLGVHYHFLRNFGPEVAYITASHILLVKSSSVVNLNARDNIHG